ncbi:MAG: dienelactone hydrolase family protein [Hyphomonadaceae bacterium]|nr:dienelactone hydrolase family protein [Hyphomonadaceae bacterium]
MNPSTLEQVEQLTASLLRTLDALGFITRHLSPIGYSHQLARAGEPDADLRTARAFPEWDDPYSALRPLLDTASDHALAAMDGLREAAAPPEDITRAFKALRHAPRALEALYPLAGVVPSVNRFFLEPALRADKELQAHFMKQPPPPNTGLMCFGEDPDARTSVWTYIPETYSPDKPHPVIFALHGGSGRGRAFIWSWLAAARTRGAILVAPTSLGQTWAIQGEDQDTPHLTHILEFIRQRWTVDPTRILLTGMSDGGTFTYTSGLEPSSPFTHLAPVAAAFHPMLVQTASSERLSRLPIHILHGQRDWMFPVDMAREAQRYFAAAGANVTYQEIDDLSHAYGTDLSSMILDWLLA